MPGILEDTEYYDSGDDNKAYHNDGTSWDEISAKHDGGDITTAILTVTNKIVLGNNDYLFTLSTGASEIATVYMDASNVHHFGQHSANAEYDGASHLFETAVTINDTLDLNDEITITGATKDINIANTSETTCGLRITDSAAPSSQYGHFLYDAGGNVAVIDTASTLDVRINGTDKIVVTSSAINFTGSVNVAINDGRLTATNTATSESGLTANCTSGSYTGSAIISQSSRAASSAWNIMAGLSSGGSDLEFKVRGDGEVTADGSFTGGGADFNELMEWLDQNPRSEDRAGIVVTGVNNPEGKPLIKPAKEGDPILGVVSPAPTVIGNSDWNRYHGKFQKDVYGRYLTEPVEYIEWEETVTEEPAESIRARHALDKIDSALLDADLDALRKAYEAARDQHLFNQVRCKELQNAKAMAERRINPVRPSQVFGSASDAFTDENQAELDALVRQDSTTAIRKAKADYEAAAQAQKLADKLRSMIISDVLWPEKTLVHSHKADEIPRGVRPPSGAVRVTLQERIISPDFDESRDHQTRLDRPEWDGIGVVGLVVIQDDQPKDPRWFNFGPVAPGLSRWLIR